tara:strand:+ start:1076 stop:1921 length:846 start_codon:yes stop_codon:yes gene_type:complete
MNDLQNIKSAQKNRHMKAILKATILCSALTLFMACSDDDAIESIDASVTPGSLDLTLDTMVGNEDFQLDTEYSIAGERVSFTQFRYWVSNIVLINKAGEHVEIPNSYFLIEETGALSIQDGAYEYPPNKRETINLSAVPGGEYIGIEFGIGIDQRYNDNLSLQAGELSQLNGMTNISWMWHTSYIFTSIKGSLLDDDTTLILETGLNDNYHTVNVALENAVEVSNTAAQEILLHVDLASIIEGIDVRTTPVVGASTPEAMELMANNFAYKSFTVAPVANED